MSETLYNQLMKHPKFSEGKQLILDALKAVQGELKGIAPHQPNQVEAYEQLIKELEASRGGKLFFPYIGSGFGKGPYVELADGSIKYDCISGIGPHYMGHCHPKLVESSLNAAVQNTLMQGHLQQNANGAALCKRLCDISGFDHCFVTSSGAMANENALKLAFQKRSPASRILAFEHCFMGRTTTLSQITDKPAFRQGLPHNLMVDYVPYFDELHPQESTKAALIKLKKYIHRHPGSHAAMCFELVQGEGGFKVGQREFFVTLIHHLKEEGIAVIFDEVQTFARTPELFAFKHYGLDGLADIVTIGKVSQVCATLFTQEWAPGPGLLSQTFTSATSAIEACMTLLDLFESEKMFGPNGKVLSIHNYLRRKAEDFSAQNPSLMQGPFGIGLMFAFTPLDGSKELALKVLHRLYENGVVAFIAGDSPTRIRFLLPGLVIEESHLDEIFSIVAKTLQEVAETATV